MLVFSVKNVGLTKEELSDKLSLLSTSQSEQVHTHSPHASHTHITQSHDAHGTRITQVPYTSASHTHSAPHTLNTPHTHASVRVVMGDCISVVFLVSALQLVPYLWNTHAFRVFILSFFFGIAVVHAITDDRISTASCPPNIWIHIQRQGLAVYVDHAQRQTVQVNMQICVMHYILIVQTTTYFASAYLFDCCCKCHPQ